MKIILKGCMQDVINDISSQLGSQIILDYEVCGCYEDDVIIYDIELDATKCLLHIFPAKLYIIRTDTPIFRDVTIADFRFEEVIIK